ncbi:MAG: PTPA-CTERM sorting domain-containing protein [Leptodesmis sp.]|uniref:PTPA-CTERM sorting domain-containing protein n=1 Tax=Leptodesmis sp. TaxID=3100501 RepID=UPI003D100AF6
MTTTNWNSIPSRNNVSSRQDLAFKASFRSPAAIPTPALLPGMLALGMNMWRKRRATTSAETSQV